MSRNRNFIAAHRLACQQISSQQFTTAAQLVAWMGITQAQDYAAAKWALALRLPGITDNDIEQAIADRAIVRSWSFRGTLHFMHPADIRWMLNIASARLLSSFGSHYRRLGLDARILARARDIMATTLQGSRQLSRSELMDAIRKKKIATDGLRSNFFMLTAALSGTICCGVRRDKEFTYTLLDEWLPPVPVLPRDEALAMLALRYFRSHGPATIHDLAWWAGITLKDARSGYEAVKHQLETVTVGDRKLHFASVPARSAKGIFLLPGFDEYLLGYKDRSDVLAPHHAKIVAGSANGIFQPTIVVNGQVAGTWKRALMKESVQVSAAPFDELSPVQTRSIDKRMTSYARYIGLPLRQ